MTPLDAAHAAMERDGADETDRLRFFECLADGEFFLLLEEEAQGTDLKPRVFPLESGPVVLIFDLEERMAEFSGGIAPYAALPGRVIAQQLAGQGIGLGVNLGSAPSQMILPPEAMDWLAGMLEDGPEEIEAVPERFHPPVALIGPVEERLRRKLGMAAGLATAALLAGVTYRDGRHGHMLVFLDPASGAEAALARAAHEAVAFSGVDLGALDVAFLASPDPAAGRIAAVATRIDLPARAAPKAPTAPSAPGMDPDRPPKLR
ncbi:SseB family protein [Rhodobacter sp. HX-7-19]|uniref:SseB family protein n=1 Tax=Paragemmobacter kunshanensis TaxID=2583234 RepID=A0A6M1TRL8_9RHOB|nr:SseB family protein [Rhodobacter kunshanensis]NGQ90858.1 SseB family protein [Rhodobacter kunshanensis]